MADRFTEDDLTAATAAHAEHVTGYSMKDGGRTYTCRCGWKSDADDAAGKAQRHRMREALAAIVDRQVDVEIRRQER